MSNLPSDTYFSNNSGWSCPKCTRIYSPIVTQCTWCNDMIRETLVPEKFTKEKGCNHDWDYSRILTSYPPKIRCTLCDETKTVGINVDNTIKMSNCT